MTETVISVSDLVKDHFSPFLRKRFRVLDGLSLSVKKNETFGLLGVNGAGKTTTLKILLGLFRATAGEVSILGHGPGDPRALARIGFLPENPYFYNYLTGPEFLDFVGQLFGLPGKLRKERISELLGLVSLDENLSVPVVKYSKGMLQRLGIAQALINDPELVFMDEPMSGLDPIGRRDVRLILVKLKEQGKTIFFNSHLLPDVNEVCDRVAVLHRGKLVGEDSISAISATGSYRDLEDYFLEMVGQAEAQRREVTAEARGS